jgi:hypothetical protein
VNCSVPVPVTIEALPGMTAMLVRAGLITVRTLVVDVLPEVAVMVADPTATPVASPALLTVAMEALLLDHVTVDVQGELVAFE